MHILKIKTSKKEDLIDITERISKLIKINEGIYFVGFRNFYYYKLLRKRNIRKVKIKIKLYKEGSIEKVKLIEIYQGWQAYANGQTHVS